MEALRRSLSMDTKIKGKASLYRMAGIIGSIATLLQALIWLILCIIAILYYAIGAPYPYKSKYNSAAAPYGYVFSQTYFNEDQLVNTCTEISPRIMCVLISIYLILTINLIISSLLLYTEFKRWRTRDVIRERATYWFLSTLTMALYELVFSVIFIAEYLSCVEQGDFNIAAAAITMASLSMKGYLMWGYNVAMALTLLCIHCCKRDDCPV